MDILQPDTMERIYSLLCDIKREVMESKAINENLTKRIVNLEVEVQRLQKTRVPITEKEEKIRDEHLKLLDKLGKVIAKDLEHV